MTPTKIAIWIGVAAAVASAFVQNPYIGIVLLVVGLYVGTTCGADESIRLGVGAVVMTHFAGNFDVVPVAGSYLHAVVASLGAVGAVASTVQVAVAGTGSTTLFTVAATEKVWAFWVRPV